MRMLIISNALASQDISYQDVEVFTWGDPDLPLVSNYEIVVLDMKVEEVPDGSFIKIQEEILNLLKVGGVVICLTYNAISTRMKYEKEYEHSYDWFHRGLAETTKLDRPSSRGTNYRLIKKSEIFKSYFDRVREFHKVIKGGEYRENQNIWKIHLWASVGSESRRFPIWHDMEVIAVNPITNEPIACVISYQDGSLIFLPQSEHSPYNAVDYLFQIGKRYYELNIEEIGRSPEVPEWIDDYKTEQEKSIEDDISQLEEKLREEKSKRAHFQKIDALLYATGKSLEKAVKLTFEEFELDVEETEIGANKDLIVKDTSGNRLLVEVTGVKGKIKQSTSGKMGQLARLIFERRSNEKIVFIGNTYREKNPRERKEENFTREVIEIAENNNICLMTTVDLFNFWKEVLEEKKTPEQVIDSILNTNSVYTIQ